MLKQKMQKLLQIVKYQIKSNKFHVTSWGEVLMNVFLICCNIASLYLWQPADQLELVFLKKGSLIKQKKSNFFVMYAYIFFACYIHEDIDSTMDCFNSKLVKP